ncbi:MAG TPA: MFS transporter [Steroidobacteraceae bacterium]
METLPESAGVAGDAPPHERRQNGTTERMKGATFALLVLFGINLLNFFDRQIPGSLGEPIRKDFHLSDTALGLLGTVFTLIYAVVGLPLGRLSDRWYRTRLIALGTAIWSVLTAASGLAQSYVQMFVSRLGVGVGEAVCAPAGQSLIGDLFPPHQRARAMAVFMLGLPAGIFAAYMVAGAAGSAWGWRSVFLLACIPGLVLAALAFKIPEPVRGALENATASKGALTDRKAYGAVLRLPTMWWIILSGLTHNFNMYALNSFQTPFLQRFHQLSLKEANTISAISIGIAGAIGLLAGGWIADKVSARRRNGRLLVPACSMAVAAPSIFLALSQPKGSTASFMALMVLGSMTMYVYYPTVYAAIQDVIAPRLRGTAVAIYFCAMYLLGASLGPVGTGLLSDHFAHQAMVDAGATTMNEAFKAAGLHSAMYAIPIFAVVASLVLFAAASTVGKDISKQRVA